MAKRTILWTAWGLAAAFVVASPAASAQAQAPASSLSPSPSPEAPAPARATWSEPSPGAEPAPTEPPATAAEPTPEPTPEPAPASEIPTTASPPDKPSDQAVSPPAGSSVQRIVRQRSMNPFRLSVLTLDQSFTTQTISVGDTPQSYVPLYELWLSFRPRYYFDEHWSVRGRFDYTKELTNAEQTTYAHEDVFGDIWTELAYETNLDRWWPGTRAELGIRAIWPTSKISQANGMYVTLGPRAGFEHAFILRGLHAPWLDAVIARASVVYLHGFTSATTPNSYGNFGYVRENVEDQSFVSDAVSGQTLPEHEIYGSVFGTLQITPRLAFNLGFVLIGQWHYPPTGNVSVGITGGPTSVPAPVNDNQFTELTWWTSELSYDIVDELTLSAGYYDLANAVAPDGQARSVFGSENIWWSPGARFFVDLTANLDAIFDDTRGHKYSRESAQASRASRVAAHIH